ncbi:hypothetical protein GCM10009415_03970 [Chitinophaga japonensis]
MKTLFLQNLKPVKMKRTNSLGLALIAAAMSFLAACQKDDAVTPTLQPLNPGEATAVTPPANGTPVAFTHANTKGTLALVSGVYQARNFHQGTVQDLVDTTQWANKAGKYFYKLSTNDGTDSTDSNYDFKFQGSATGDFVVNTSRYTLAYIDLAFGSVSASTTGYTTVSSGVLGYNTTSVPGWYNYNILTHIVTAVPNRTILLIEDGTPVYKIRINSIYKDGAPDSGFAATDYPYYSFDYAEL